MKKILYIIAMLMLIGWVVGAFVFNTGMFIHLLLFTSILLLMQAVIITPKARTENGHQEIAKAG